MLLASSAICAATAFAGWEIVVVDGVKTLVWSDGPDKIGEPVPGGSFNELPPPQLQFRLRSNYRNVEQQLISDETAVISVAPACLSREVVDSGTRAAETSTSLITSNSAGGNNRTTDNGPTEGISNPAPVGDESRLANSVLPNSLADSVDESNNNETSGADQQ